jgi:2-polyprenyl-6-hydroxyphenyl methylase/3-demethylubiquinone-9 3-methyltransferase
MSAQRSSVDEAEVLQFDRLGEDWWNLDGSMRPLHRLNPVRVGWIRDTIVEHLPRPDGTMRDISRGKPFAGLRILDIGCGGGILSEPMARLGAEVTGIDPAPGNVEIAARHAIDQGLTIDYRQTTAEALLAEGATFDVVLAMEVIEHVVNPGAFAGTCVRLARPGGLIFGATLNRTLKSFALAIVGAEYILRWVPRGTHRWEKFLTPREFERALRCGGAVVLERSGLVYNPLRDQWLTAGDMDVNYMLAAQRRVQLAAG